MTGSGLGLASTYSIVKRHEGYIGVSSIVNKGTTFKIYLPSIGEAYSSHQAVTAPQIAANHKGGSVLVMDDEEIIRKLASEMLTYLGYQVTTCVNGEEALSRYKAARESGTPFSAVIMDLTIPGGMGGGETAERIRAIDPEAFLIVSSGYSNDPIMADYKTYGFSDAVAKPYNVTELEKVLSSLPQGNV
jgi:CheY-like chemotaxis protein